MPSDKKTGEWESQTKLAPATQRAGTGVGLCALNMLNIVSVRVHVPLRGTAGSQNWLAIVQSQRAVWPSGDKVVILSEREWVLPDPRNGRACPSDKDFLWLREADSTDRHEWSKTRPLTALLRFFTKSWLGKCWWRALFTFFSVKQDSVCSIQGAHSCFFIENPEQKNNLWMESKVWKYSWFCCKLTTEDVLNKVGWGLGVAVSRMRQIGT